MVADPMILRYRVIRIYKGKAEAQSIFDLFDMFLAELLHLGREYPLGYDYFKPRLHRAFASQASITDTAEIEKALGRAEFVKKGICAVTSDHISVHQG